MIARHLTSGPVSRELAGSIRKVNARHAAIGSPEIPGLKESWLRLDRTLSVAIAAGDEVAARHAVAEYERDALDAIEQAAR